MINTTATPNTRARCVIASRSLSEIDRTAHLFDPGPLTSGSDFQRQPVKLAANPLHVDRRGAGMDAIREQDHDAFAIGIDPQRCSAKPGAPTSSRPQLLRPSPSTP